MNKYDLYGLKRTNLKTLIKKQEQQLEILQLMMQRYQILELIYPAMVYDQT